MNDEELFAELAARLRDVQRRVSSLNVEPAEKASITRRFHAITDASTHDLQRAARRLDALVHDLDARFPEF